MCNVGLRKYYMVWMISNSHRLKLGRFNSEVLELHRLHADLIMMCKILNFICINLKNCISVSTMDSARKNTFKLYKYRANLDIRKIFLLRKILMCGNHYQMTFLLN